MKTLIFLHLPVIETQNGGYFFSGFYLLGFLLAIAVFMIGSIRNKIPVRTTLLVTATCALFFILGDKLFAIEPGSWKNIFTDPEAFSHTGKTALGGIIGLGIAIFISGKWLGLKNSLPDRFAIALPLGMAFTRLGCLMAGCCFGSPSALPWAIQYGQHSHAFFSQLQNGLISPLAAASLPVHPVPVYEMIGCLMIALAIWLTRRYWKAPGSRMLFMVMLYGVVRFILEFFRDPAGNKFAGTEFWGIKYVQWIVIAGIVVPGMILWFRERRKKGFAVLQPFEFRTGDFSFVSLTVFLLLVYMTVINWLTPLERFTAGMALLPALGNSWWTVFRRMTVPSLRTVTFLLPVAGLIFMSQTYIPEKGSKIRYHEMNFGAIYNSLHLYPQIAYNEDCGGFSWRETENREDKFYIVGGGYSVNDIFGKYNRASFGFNGFLGYKNESYTKTNNGNIQIGVNPYYSHDWRWFGCKGGVILGYFNIDGIYTGLHATTQVGDYSGLLLDLYAFPQVSVRVGPMDILFFDIRLADQLPGRSPYTLLQLGIGSGLGKFNGTQLRVGVTPYFGGGSRNNVAQKSIMYAQIVYPIKEKYVVDLYLGSNFATGDAAKNCISIGFQYRYGYTTVARKVKGGRKKK